jgi:hypothetical protein
MKNITDLLSIAPQSVGENFSDSSHELSPLQSGMFIHESLATAIDVETKTVKEAKGGRVTALKRTSMEFLAQKTAEALARTQDPAQQELGFGIERWTSDRRGVPNPLIRGGLFGTRLSAKRQSFKAEKIASLSNSTVHYSGEELRQDDLSVWMSIVNKGRGRVSGQPIMFTAYELIKDMKWRIHSESYTRLRDCIERLKVTSVKVASKDEKAAYAGSLIRDYTFDAVSDEGKPRWQVRLEPSIVKLFINENTTLIEWEQRKLIGTRASLTLWLHIFYSSHRDPIPFLVQKIHELCRSDEQRMTNFKSRLRASLERLIEIGFLASFTIKNDMVHVKRSLYADQIAK